MCGRTTTGKTATGGRWADEQGRSSSGTPRSGRPQKLQCRGNRPALENPRGHQRPETCEGKEAQDAQRKSSPIRAGWTGRAQLKGTMNQQATSGEAGRGLGVATLLGRSSILSEILEYRKSELIAGRTPAEIKLTDEQCRRLKEWCDGTATVCIAPDGSTRISPGPKYSEGMIFGMRFNCPNDPSSATGADNPERKI